MNIVPRHRPESGFRVLLAGRAGAASNALAGWVIEQTGASLSGPGDSVAETLALAAEFQPHVVLLDFHGLAGSTVRTVSLFKELSPSPVVVVLTHDASNAMRRRCRDARVDAVFDKTAELEPVAALLKKIRKSQSPSRSRT